MNPAVSRPLSFSFFVRALGLLMLAVSLPGQSALAKDNTWTNKGTDFNSNGSWSTVARGSRVTAMSIITVNSGGTLLLSNSGTTDQIKNTTNMGVLTLQRNSIIDMGNATSIIPSTDSHSSSWSKTLKFDNWSGTLGIGAETDDLFFGSNGNRLTSSQLAGIQLFRVQERLFMAAQ